MFRITVFPLTESDSHSDILSDPVIMETVEICKNWHTGSDSDFNVYCTYYLGSERISESESVHLY